MTIQNKKIQGNTSALIYSSLAERVKLVCFAGLTWGLQTCQQDKLEDQLVCQ